MAREFEPTQPKGVEAASAIGNSAKSQAALVDAGTMVLVRILSFFSTPDPPAPLPPAFAHVPDALAKKQREAQIQKEVDSGTSAHGVRPRRYAGFINDASNDAERRFRDALPFVTATLNQLLQEKGVPAQVTEAEIAVNFLAECAPTLQAGETSAQSNGQFGGLGFELDRFVAKYNTVKAWLPPSARDEFDKLLAAPDLGQVHMNVEQGLEANAAMYADAMTELERDLAKHGSSLSTLPPSGRVFWTTVYFNAGAGVGAELLEKHGVDYFKQRWHGADNPSVVSKFGDYNAQWRTASFELLNAGNGPHDVALPESVREVPTRLVSKDELAYEERSLRRDFFEPALRGDAKLSDPRLATYIVVLDGLLSTELNTDHILPEWTLHCAQARAYQSLVTQILKLTEMDADLIRFYVKGPLPHWPDLTLRECLVALQTDHFHLVATAPGLVTFEYGSIDIFAADQQVPRLFRVFDPKLLSASD